MKMESLIFAALGFAAGYFVGTVDNSKFNSKVNDYFEKMKPELNKIKDQTVDLIKKASKSNNTELKEKVIKTFNNFKKAYENISSEKGDSIKDSSIKKFNKTKDEMKKLISENRK